MSLNPPERLDLSSPPSSSSLAGIPILAGATPLPKRTLLNMPRKLRTILPPRKPARQLTSEKRRESESVAEGPPNSSPGQAADVPSIAQDAEWYSNGIKYGGEGAPYARYLSQPDPRTCIPVGGDALQMSVMAAWRKDMPTPEAKAAVRELLQNLTALLNIKSGTEGRYIVDVFGSVAWGGDLRALSDVDMVVIDKELPLGYAPSLWRTSPPDRVNPRRKRTRGPNSSGVKRDDVPPITNSKVPEIYSTRWLQPVLVGAGLGLREVERFTFEPSSMVKFRIHGNDSYSVTINNLGGWYAAQLLQAYCEISPYVLRPLLNLLKHWIKAHGLNREGAKTLGCHTIVLSAVAYLQHVGVLPNLQAGVIAPPSSDPRIESLEDTVWVNWAFEQGAVAHIAFERRPPPGWSPRKMRSLPKWWRAREMTAADAVRGYFKFITALDFTTHFLSVLHGGVVRRRCPPGSFKGPGSPGWEGHPGIDHIGKCDVYQPDTWDRHLVLVQDPFQWTKNCAANLGQDKKIEQQFFECARQTHRLLKRNPHATFNDLMRVGHESEATAREPAV